MILEVNNEAEKNAQLKNAVGELTSQIPSASLSQLPRIRIAATSLLSGASPEMEKLLNALINKVENREREVEGALTSQITSGNEKIKEEVIEKNIASLENEAREREIKKLLGEYESFKEEFHRRVDKKYKLLKQAADGHPPLSAKQQDQLVGKYTDEEKAERAETNKWWKTQHTLRKAISESITYRQSAFDENQKLINGTEISQDEREKLAKENAVHTEEIKFYTEKAKSFEGIDKKVERDRKVIFELAINNKEAATIQLKEHLDDHGEHYDYESKRDAQYKGHKELHSIVIKLDLPKEAGSSKSLHSLAEIIEMVNNAAEKQQETSKRNVVNAKVQAIKKVIANGMPPEGPTDTPNGLSGALQRQKAQKGHVR